MSRAVVLPLSLMALLTGCTSFHRPCIKSDLYETQVRAAQALEGNTQAFARLDELRAEWADRGKQGFVYKVTPWDRANRDRAASIADAAGRVSAGRDAILSQRELSEVMLNALKDLESEYDSISAMREESGEQGAAMTVAGDQKYLARRMMNSLLLMSQADMSSAVEAADIFGRDVSRFQQQLDAEINGNDELGIEPPSNPEVEDSLSQVEELFTGYVADSSGDVLENVVARYDAWSALKDIGVIGDAVLMKAPEKEAAPAAAAEAAADEAAGAEDEAAEEEVVEDEAAGAEDEAGDDTAAESVEGAVDDADAGGESADEDAAADDEAVDGEPAEDDEGGAP